MTDFYNELSSDGVLFFWIIAALIVLLIVLLVVLFLKNKKLSNLINNMSNEKSINDTDTEDIIINKPSITYSEAKEEKIVSENVDVNKDNENIKKEPVIEEKEIIEEKVFAPKADNNVVEETGPYKKNILREMSKKMPTSPIEIVREEPVNKEENINYYLREDMVSPLEEMEDNYNINDNMKFASEIVEQMEKEIKPSNIELTDYEKKQEEEAIISYDELLKVKDKIYNITEDEEDDEFLDELKNFRLDLQ